jgi:ABC-2 type transport system ATP-binding protein
VLSEVQQTVDDVVIIAGGRLVHASTLAELSALAEPRVRVVSPDVEGLNALVSAAGFRRAPRTGVPGVAELLGTDVATVGRAAHGARLELHELTSRSVGLEDVFLRLTSPRATPPDDDPGSADPTAAPGGAR